MSWTACGARQTGQAKETWTTAGGICAARSRAYIEQWTEQRGLAALGRAPCLASGAATQHEGWHAAGQKAGPCRLADASPLSRQGRGPGVRPSLYSAYVGSKSRCAYRGPMSSDVIVPITVFAMYAVALGATALVCYRFRHEIFE
jgi:hypothetical protein